MRTQQRGVTMIGWIFLLVPMAIVIYAGIRVVPKFLDYYKLVSAMKETATKLKSDETLTPATIRGSLEKRFDTGYIDMDVKDIEVSKNDTGDWQMTADYDEEAPLFGNMSLQLKFHETVVIN